MEIKLILTINEVNVLMNALGNMPYAQVFELVQKVRQQAQSQIQVEENTKE